MTEDLIRVVIVGLAAWRLAHLFVGEEGPWGIFRRLRLLAGAEIDLALEPADPLVARINVPGEGFLAQLLSCVWCLSVWTSLLFWGLWEVHWAIPGAVAAMAIAVLAQGVAGD